MTIKTTPQLQPLHIQCRMTSHMTYSSLATQHRIIRMCFCSVGNMVRIFSFTTTYMLFHLFSLYPCSVRATVIKQSQTAAKNNLRRIHVPKDLFGNDKLQWSLHAHACLISIFNVNEKNQNHMKCPFQCAKQRLICKKQRGTGDQA